MINYFKTNYYFKIFSNVRYVWLDGITFFDLAFCHGSVAITDVLKLLAPMTNGRQIKNAEYGRTTRLHLSCNRTQCYNNYIRKSIYVPAFCSYVFIYLYRVSRARVFATGMEFELLTPGRE